MNKLLCFLLLCSTTIFGQNNMSYSLLEAQDFALKNHLSIKNSDLAIQKSQELKKEYLAIGLPQVSANSGFNNFLNLPVQVVSAKFLNPNANEGEVVSFKGGTDYSLLGNVQVNQLLFNGSYFVALAAAKALIDLQKTQALQTKDDVIFNVSQAYHLAAVAKENLSFADSMLLITAQLLEKQKSIFEVGVITQEEVDQMNYAYLSAKNAQASSELQFKNSMALLKMAMFLPFDQEISLKESTSELLQKSNLNLSGLLSNNYTLQILQKQILLDKLDIRNKKMAIMPILRAQFQHSYVAYRNELNFFANQSWYPQTSWGIQLSMPIFTSGSGRAVISQSKIKLMQDENILKITEQALKMQEIKEMNNLIGAKQKLELQNENLKLAGKIYANSILKEQIGKESSIVVTQKYNQLMIAQTQYVGAMVELFQAKLSLDKLYNQILTTK
ncbi:MAG: TolC family protein [Flavobacteriia bacterium]|nr:TolC family protein [Flavobacteriia bacterium]